MTTHLKNWDELANYAYQHHRLLGFYPKAIGVSKACFDSLVKLVEGSLLYSEDGTSLTTTNRLHHAKMNGVITVSGITCVVVE